MPAMLKEAIRNLRDRIMMIVGRAVLEAVDDDKSIQELKMRLLRGEIRNGMEHFQNYGFTSKPMAGAEGVVVFPGGNRDHGLVIAVDDRRYRLKGLEDGEVALYTDEGDKIHLKRGGNIEVVGGTKVTVNSPAIDLGAGAVVALLKGPAFQTIFNAHTHISAVPGSPTGPPVPLSTSAELTTVVKAT